MSDSPEDVKMVPRFDDASEGGDDLMEAMGIDPKDPKDGTTRDSPDGILVHGESSTDASVAVVSVETVDSQAPDVSANGEDPGTSTSIKDPEREFYKCKKGHVTEDMWAHVARENAQGGEIIEDSGPICRVCFVRWVKKMFPVKRTKQTPNLKAVA